MEKEDFGIREVFRDVDLENVVQEFNYENNLELDLVEGLQVLKRSVRVNLLRVDF